MDNLKRSLANFYSVGPSQRLSDRRRQSSWLRSALSDSATRFVPMWRERHLLHMAPATPGVFLATLDFLPDHLDLERDAILLGDSDGSACFAIELDFDEDRFQDWLPEGFDAQDLRQLSPVLDEREGALLAYARAMMYWHQRHRFCGDCGSATLSDEGGHVRVCTNSACAAKHFPRTDPAIIVLLADETDEYCLLGRQAVWAAGMYSCLAGFVEPGETLEHAVVREVAEESGIKVEKVRYHSSQPWPFPGSIMLGFMAVAKRGPIILHDQELEDARWFSRADMVRAINDGSLKVSRPISISYRLIEDWFNSGSDISLTDVVRASQPKV